MNRDGIGAWVEVIENGRSIRRQVMPTRSYLSQSELPVTVGLGAAEFAESVSVKWPGSQAKSEKKRVLGDRVITLQSAE